MIYSFIYGLFNDNLINNNNNNDVMKDLRG